MGRISAIFREDKDFVPIYDCHVTAQLGQMKARRAKAMLMEIVASGPMVVIGWPLTFIVLLMLLGPLALLGKIFLSFQGLDLAGNGRYVIIFVGIMSFALWFWMVQDSESQTRGSYLKPVIVKIFAAVAEYLKLSPPADGPDDRDPAAWAWARLAAFFPDRPWTWRVWMTGRHDGQPFAVGFCFNFKKIQALQVLSVPFSLDVAGPVYLTYADLAKVKPLAAFIKDKPLIPMTGELSEIARAHGDVALPPDSAWNHALAMLPLGLRENPCLVILDGERLMIIKPVDFHRGMTGGTIRKLPDWFPLCAKLVLDLCRWPARVMDALANAGTQPLDDALLFHERSPEEEGFFPVMRERILDRLQIPSSFYSVTDWIVIGLFLIFMLFTVLLAMSGALGFLLAPDFIDPKFHVFIGFAAWFPIVFVTAIPVGRITAAKGRRFRGQLLHALVEAAHGFLGDRHLDQAPADAPDRLRHWAHLGILYRMSNFRVEYVIGGRLDGQRHETTILSWSPLVARWIGNAPFVEIYTVTTIEYPLALAAPLRLVIEDRKAKRQFQNRLPKNQRVTLGGALARAGLTAHSPDPGAVGPALNDPKIQKLARLMPLMTDPHFALALDGRTLVIYRMAECSLHVIGIRPPNPIGLQYLARGALHDLLLPERVIDALAD